jgi:hypothetical protein
MPEGKNLLIAISIATAIFVAFGLVDFAAPQIMSWSIRNDTRWLFFLAVGVCTAQVTLIASWAVLAPGNIVVRFPWTLLLGLMMWYLLALGEYSTPAPWHRPTPDDVILLGIVLLLGVTILQVPLWIAKMAFRVRIVRAEQVHTPRAKERFQFDLRDLLIGTFVFAVALSPIRYMLPKESIRSLWPDSEMIVLIPLATAAALIATLPCLWIGFRRRVLALIAVWAGYELIIAGIEYLIVVTFLRAPREMKIYGVLAICNLTQAAVVFAVARIYYALGYRLQRVPQCATLTKVEPAEEPVDG